MSTEVLDAPPSLDQQLESLKVQREVQYRGLIFQLVITPGSVPAEDVEDILLKARRSHEQLKKDIAAVTERRNAADGTHQRMRAGYEVKREQWDHKIGELQAELQLTKARVIALEKEINATQWEKVNARADVMHAELAANAALYKRRTVKSEAALRAISVEIQSCEAFIARNIQRIQFIPSVEQRKKMMLFNGGVDPISKLKEWKHREELEALVKNGKTDMKAELAEATRVIEDIIALPARWAKVQAERKALWERHAAIVAGQADWMAIDLTPGHPERGSTLPDHPEPDLAEPDYRLKENVAMMLTAN